MIEEPKIDHFHYIVVQDVIIKIYSNYVMSKENINFRKKKEG
jgi:hypothetical protein